MSTLNLQHKRWPGLIWYVHLARLQQLKAYICRSARMECLLDALGKYYEAAAWRLTYDRIEVYKL